MDISLLQNLQNLLRQAQQLQGQAAAELSVVEAEVKDIRLITRDQQVSLLQKLQRTSANAGSLKDRPTSNPDNLQQRVQLLQQALRENAPLYLIKLLVGKKSTVALSPNQISVGSLFTLQRTDAGLISINAPTQTNHKQNPHQSLIENLRLHLPAAERSQQSLKTLDQLLQAIRKLPVKEQQALQAHSLVRGLDTLLKNILAFPANKGSDIKIDSALLSQLKSAIGNNGGFLENKVFEILKPLLSAKALATAKALVTAKESPGAAQKPGVTMPTTQHNEVSRLALSKTSNEPAQILSQNNTSPGSQNLSRAMQTAQYTATVIQGPADKNPPGYSPKPEFANLLASLTEHDKKAILLGLLQNLQASSTPAGSHNAPVFDKNFLALLKNLGFRLPQDKQQNPNREISNQLRQLVQNNLSRIQSLQIQNLLSRSTETGNNTQIEIHMRIQDHIYPLHLYFQERIIKIKHEEKEKENKREKRKIKRQWKVFMEFELEDSGWFASELSLIDEKLNTRFWAKHQRTRDRLLNKLQGLKNNMQAAGLDVEEIQVLPGDIPRARQQFEQHLVDIQT